MYLPAKGKALSVNPLYRYTVMQFKRLLSGEYQATRKDGQVITIYKLEEPCCGDLWGSSYEGDFHGHCNSGAPTKRELVAIENRIEENATDEELEDMNFM